MIVFYFLPLETLETRASVLVGDLGEDSRGQQNRLLPDCDFKDNLESVLLGPSWTSKAVKGSLKLVCS